MTNTRTLFWFKDKRNHLNAEKLKLFKFAKIGQFTDISTNCRYDYTHEAIGNWWCWFPRLAFM